MLCDVFFVFKLQVVMLFIEILEDDFCIKPRSISACGLLGAAGTLTTQKDEKQNTPCIYNLLSTVFALIKWLGICLQEPYF